MVIKKGGTLNHPVVESRAKNRGGHRDASGSKLVGLSVADDWRLVIGNSGTA